MALIEFCIFILCMHAVNHNFLIYSLILSHLISFQQYSAEQQFITNKDSLVKTRISLTMPLKASHFHGVTNELTLKCEATILNLYSESTDMKLNAIQGDPRPERGK